MIINGLQIIEIIKLLLNLLLPLLNLLKMLSNLPLMSLLNWHNYLLPPLSRQLKQHLTLKPPNHKTLLEYKMQLLHARVARPVNPEHSLLGVAVSVTELFETTEYIRSQDLQEIVDLTRPCEQRGSS